MRGVAAETEPRRLATASRCHRQPRTRAVAEGGAGNRVAPVRRVQAADAAQGVGQPLGVRRELRVWLQVLQCAAAAAPEMRAARRGALRCDTQQFDRLGLVEAGVVAHDARPDLFSGQGAAHEYGLAFDAPDAAPVVGPAVDVEHQRCSRAGRAHGTCAGAGVRGFIRAA